MSNAGNVSIILCTIILSDSLSRVFKGDAAIRRASLSFMNLKCRNAERGIRHFHETQRSAVYWRHVTESWLHRGQRDSMQSQFLLLD